MSPKIKQKSSSQPNYHSRSVKDQAVKKSTQDLPKKQAVKQISLKIYQKKKQAVKKLSLKN